MGIKWIDIVLYNKERKNILELAHIKKKSTQMSINLFFLLLYNNMLTSSLTNIDDDWGNTKKN